MIIIVKTLAAGQFRHNKRRRIARSSSLTRIAQRKVIDARGAVTVTQLTDAKGYQEFFAKLDKGLFLEREGL